MRHVALTAVLLAAVVAGNGCTHSRRANETAVDAGPATPLCTASAPCPLTSGASVQGTIGATGQVNAYSITVPADFPGKRPIIQVQLTPPAVVSPVQLVFTLAGPVSTTVLGTRGPPSRTDPQPLAGNFLTPGPGTYTLVVRDANGIASDARNAYAVSATVFNDPDSGEPDDSVPMARPLVAGTPVQGFLAFSGDRDLVAFTMSATGLMHFVVNKAASSGPLQLQMQILLLSQQTPDDLITATPVAAYAALQPGAALNVDVIRMLAPGSYVIELTDVSGTGSDASAAAGWTLTGSAATNPDPNCQNGMNNDTAQTASIIAATGTTTVEGIIAYDGDRDWFHIPVPASEQAQIVQVAIDPMTANEDVQLLWAVGTQLTPPAGACDTACGPTLFCTSNKCGYALHAMRDYVTGDTTKQEVRIRVEGGAQDIYVLVQDQGDDNYTTKPFALTVDVLPDPDPNEPSVSNDTIPTATPLAMSLDSDGGVHYAGSGMISWWDYVDGVPQYAEPEDLDWFALPLPPPVPAPCPYLPDGGDDGGLPDGGLGDGGCPTGPDGGILYLPPPYYGLTMRWHGPGDDVYQLGLQGVVDVGDAGKTACLFSFDQRYAHDDGDGGFVLGGDAGDPCFCLPSAQAGTNEFWVRIDAPHRPISPAANAYSDEPYGFELDMAPATLQASCRGACADLTKASACPQ
jgi:hypothetical protein